MKENATLKLSKFIYDMQFSDLPQDTIYKTKEVILDYIGVILAGCDKKSIISEKITDLIINNGGMEEASIIGKGVKVPLMNAALVNGVVSHVVELDDGHRIARGHPGVTVISSALSSAEYACSNGRDLITAIVTGYDIFTRIASSINPSHLERGFHTTGTCGTFAAAAAAAKLFKLNQEEISNALGLAGIQSAGLLEVTIDGQMAKALHSGKSAQSGVLSAILAKNGVQGPKSVIEGSKGFVTAMSDDCNFDLMLRNFNEKYYINECYIKLYPSCRHTHSPVDAVLSIIKENNFDVSDINKIIIKTYPTAISFAGKIFKPESSEAAKFSIAYCTCAALVKKKFGLKELESDCLNDSLILKLIEKVSIFSDSKLESSNPKIKGAEVTILLNNGTSLFKRVELPKGEPENPVSKDELIRKFSSCTSQYFNDDIIEKIVEYVFNIDELDSINILLGLLNVS